MNGGKAPPPGSDAQASESDQGKTTVDGTILDGAYRVFRVLGEGGMGTVYEGLQLRLNKRVAVKVMSRELAANKEALARFHREAEITSSIGHPHIVHVTDFGTTPSGEPFMVMEFLEGEDLETRLKRVSRLPPAKVAHIIRQIASALTAAHEKGIVHRDLKPANVYLLNVAGEIDFVKVVDFGISKVRAAVTKLTRESTVIGTPQYMSPEQAMGRGQEIDVRTDEWALACIAWEMLSGQCPFTGEDVASLLYQVVHEAPAPLSASVPGLRAEAEEVLRRALAKKRTERFASVGAFSQAFETAMLGAVTAPDLTPAPQPLLAAIPKETVSYGFAATQVAESAEHRKASDDAPTLRQPRPLPTTFSRTAGEIWRGIRLPIPLTRRAMAIGGGVLLLLVAGALVLFRSSSSPKGAILPPPVSTPVAAPRPRVEITPAPARPPVEAPPAPAAKPPTAIPKTKRPKPSADLAVPSFEARPKPSPFPSQKPRPKPKRELILDP